MLYSQLFQKLALNAVQKRLDEINITLTQHKAFLIFLKKNVKHGTIS